MTDCNETMLLLDSSLDPPLRTGTSTHRYKHHSAQYIILSISAIILILDISSCVAVVPQTVILEDIVCSKYYSSLVYATSGTKFDGDRCKIEPVQSEVALVNGWKDTFEAIPGR
jgi:hypothetical protein